MDQNDYLITIDMDDEAKRLVAAAETAIANAKREEVKPEHEPKRPLVMFKLPHVEATNRILAHFFTTEVSAYHVC